MSNTTKPPFQLSPGQQKFVYVIAIINAVSWGLSFLIGFIHGFVSASLSH